MGLITVNKEVPFQRPKTGRAANPDYRFCVVAEETTTHIHFYSGANSNKIRLILGTDFFEELAFKPRTPENYSNFEVKLLVLDEPSRMEKNSSGPTGLP